MHLALLALISSSSYQSKVTPFEGTHIFQTYIYTGLHHDCRQLVVSAVRSHNILRVSKSYKSFGNRFTTTTVDDLVTSDLTGCKGSVTRYSCLFSQAEYISGVDAIMHVASPLFNTTDPQVMIDVRIGGTSIQVLMFSDFPKQLFLGRCVRYHTDSRCRCRRRCEAGHYHSEYCIARLERRFLERNDCHRDL